MDPGRDPAAAYLPSTSSKSLTGSGRRRGAHGLGTGLPELSTLTSGDDSHGGEPPGSEAERAILESDASFKTARGDSLSLGGAPSGVLSEADEAEAGQAAGPGHDAQPNGQQPGSSGSQPEVHGQPGQQAVTPVDPRTAGVAAAMPPGEQDAQRRPLTSLPSYHASDNPFE